MGIHAAVVRSNGKDAYTGEELDWSLLSSWNNDKAKAQGSDYKKNSHDSLRLIMSPAVVVQPNSRSVHGAQTMQKMTFPLMNLCSCAQKSSST